MKFGRLALFAETEAISLHACFDHRSDPRKVTMTHAQSPLVVTRRRLLKSASLGMGSLALASLLHREGSSDDLPIASEAALPAPHFTPRVKSVIFLFMEGAVSQVDSFDYKPSLEKYDGQDPHEVIGKLEKTQFAAIGKVMRSPWKFQQCGESGLWASSLFPHMAGMDGHRGIMDDICVVRSMTSRFPEHTSANYFLHSGVGLQGRPSMGSWVTYGLGSRNENLPGYIVLNGGQIPSGGLDNFSNGFLPAIYQGSLLNAIGPPLANVLPNEKVADLQPAKRQLVRLLNEESLRLSGGDDALESAIANYELAARMQTAIPDLMDLSQESQATQSFYGVDSANVHTQTYARQCIIARRLVEQGVRFVECTIPSTGQDRWDAHGNLKQNHGQNALAVDQPIAALLQDLKQRGLFDETLVVWSGEFGRTPFAQGSDGRDHNEHGFSLWLAGGGVKPGIAYGETDMWGYKAIRDRLEMHDLHATIMHLLGIDHTKLTFRFSGRDIRLTDVYGRVIEEILS